jgi:hypothetical protein
MARRTKQNKCANEAEIVLFGVDLIYLRSVLSSPASHPTGATSFDVSQIYPRYSSRGFVHREVVFFYRSIGERVRVVCLSLVVFLKDGGSHSLSLRKQPPSP